MEFQFVNSTVADPAVPQDLAVRNLIRKQAMKKASAARKKDGNYGKHNLRQFPVFVCNPENTPIEPTVEIVEVKDSPTHKKSISPPAHDVIAALPPKPKDSRLHNQKKEKGLLKRQQWLAKLSLAESLSTGMSAKGYELTSMKHDFNILELSTLATLHVGRFTRSELFSNPNHLIAQLRSKYDPQFTYLSFLPSRYDQVGVLSDAADCVIARARYIVSPNKVWESAVITFYVRALHSLQKALDDPKQRFSAEVLCATEILALYELLDPSGTEAWVRHTAGAARLIQVRGPKSYNSDFEKALFMGHTVPIVTESLFNGQHCFLEQKSWQKVLKSCVQDTPNLTDRSEIVIALLLLKTKIPGYFDDVSYIICKHGSIDIPDVELTACKLRELRLDFLDWHVRYRAYTKARPTVRSGSVEYDSHCKVYAIYLCCMLLTARLLGALSDVEREELEQSALVLADQMFKLDAEVRNVSTQTTLFLAQTVGVSHSINMTTKDWDGHDRSGDRYDGVISRATFEGWNNLCGRKLPE